MQKYDGNAAYDLELFEESPRKPKKKIEKRRAPKKQPQKETASINLLQSIKIAVAATVIICAVGVMINGRVQLTETKTEISEKQSELTAAQSENTRLNMELNSSVSLDNVENYAVNVLGMKKIEKYQMEYIDLSDANKFEIENKKSEDSSESINQKLKEILKKGSD